MREITHEELKQIQLGILDKVHDFCEKNGITYFLSSGTLIGAVRHKGYIPWDDDLDLYMPRADYDKFIKLFSANSPENTKLLSLETDKKYQYPFAKVIDDRTEMVESLFGENFKIGVYIDIFPLECVPEGMRRFIFWFLRASFLSLLLGVSRAVSANKWTWVSREPSAKKRVLKTLIYPVFRVIGHRFFLSRYDSFVRNHQGEGKYVYNMSGGIGIHGCFRGRAVRESVDIEFEGKKYKTMVGFNEYLFVTYGDFMVLPPVEERKPMHSFSAWWK